MSKIILIHPTSGHEFEFDEDHAKRILNMPNSGGGWKRKKEKKANAAKRRGNTTKAKGADQQGDDKASD